MIDFYSLFSQLFSTYWWLLPLFVVAALFKSTWFKGFIGEVMVNFSALLFQGEYVHLNNSYMVRPALQGKSSIGTKESLHTYIRPSFEAPEYSFWP